MHLIIQNTYHEVQIGLFDDDILIERHSIDKTQSSTLCVPTIHALLQNHNVTIKDLAFIGTNKGPGPFTTLRVVIATVNGISFATGIPLIGIDAFDALLHEHKNIAPHILLFNAFGNDLYYAIKTKSELEKGVENTELLFSSLKERFKNEQIMFSGNGAHMHKKLITQLFDAHAVINSVEYPSLEAINSLAYHEWQHGAKGTHQILPLYLKKFPGSL